MDNDTYYVGFVREEGAIFALLKFENTPAYGRYNFNVENTDGYWEKIKDKVTVIEPIWDTHWG